MRLMGSMHHCAVWLRGPLAVCDGIHRDLPRTWRLVLLGAPGVGKGTQASLLQERLGTCHFSTGDVFRTAKALAPAERTPAIQNALDHMRRGELVPDGMVLDCIKERIRCFHCKNGFLLDGFPRTIPQAEVLNDILRREHIPLDGVIKYELPTDVIVARLSGRRMCTRCPAVFHLENHPPKAEGLCDQCGSVLHQREDDRPETVRIRMEAYERSTAPVKDYFRRMGLLRFVEAVGTPAEICQRTIRILELNA